MRRFLIALATCALLSSDVAQAKVVSISATPNPAALGERVRHSLDVGAYGRLEVWVSAAGFQQPGTGTLPPGAWSHECCPGQTAGTPAWHYRSSTTVSPGYYRFGAVARSRGTFLSTALVSGGSDGVWIRVR